MSTRCCVYASCSSAMGRKFKGTASIMDGAMVRGLPKNFLGRKSLLVRETLSLIRMNALQRTKFSHQKR